jgi:hypothetical protein
VDCPGNKVHSPQEGLAGSSCPNRCPRDCCTSSRCVGGCACASAEPGSPIASRCFCSSNRAVVRSRRRPTSLHMPSNAPTTPSNTPISDLRPGMRCGRASTSHHEERGSTRGCRHMPVRCRDGSRSRGRRWRRSSASRGTGNLASACPLNSASRHALTDGEHFDRCWTVRGANASNQS